MLSKKAKYGLKALIYLAAQPVDRSVLIADIANQERIPKKFLEAILLELRKAGYLGSKKGKGGGGEGGAAHHRAAYVAAAAARLPLSPPPVVRRRGPCC